MPGRCRRREADPGSDTRSDGRSRSSARETTGHALAAEIGEFRRVLRRHGAAQAESRIARQMKAEAGRAAQEPVPAGDVGGHAGARALLVLSVSRFRARMRSRTWRASLSEPPPLLSRTRRTSGWRRAPCARPQRVRRGTRRAPRGCARCPSWRRSSRCRRTVGDAGAGPGFAGEDQEAHREQDGEHRRQRLDRAAGDDRADLVHVAIRGAEDADHLPRGHEQQEPDADREIGREAAARIDGRTPGR